MKKPVCLMCSVFDSFIDKSAHRERFSSHVVIDSKLHLTPEVLRQKQDEAVSRLLSQGEKVLVLFGRCRPRGKSLHKEGISVVPVTNCIEAVLETERYKRFLKERAFFLFEDWCLRWREIILDMCPGKEDIARRIVREEHAKFVYLKGPGREVAMDSLKECAEYFDLPYQVEEYTLDNFDRMLGQTLNGDD